MKSLLVGVCAAMLSACASERLERDSSSNAHRAGSRESDAAIGAARAPSGAEVAGEGSVDRLDGHVVLVATRGDNRVTALCPTDLATLWTMDVGVGAHELALSPDGRLAAGSAYGGPGQGHMPPDRRVAIWSTTEKTLLHTVDLEEHVRPNDLVFLPDGKHLLLTSEVRGALLLIDVTEGEIERTIELSEVAGHMLCHAPDAEAAGGVGLAYVSHVVSGRISVVDVGTGEVVARLDAQAGAEGIACTRDGRRVLCASNRSHSMTVFDGRTFEHVATIEAPGFPFRVELDAAGRTAVVCCPMANEIAVHDVDTGALVRRFSLAELGADTAPIGVAVAPDGSRAYVVCAAAGLVVSVDLESGAILARRPVGPILDGIAIGRRA